MLTDVAIKKLKSKEKPYKVADRDGMYVYIATSGSMTFRYDYRLALSQTRLRHALRSIEQTVRQQRRRQCAMR